MGSGVAEWKVIGEHQGPGKGKLQCCVRPHACAASQGEQQQPESGEDPERVPVSLPSAHYGKLRFHTPLTPCQCCCSKSHRVLNPPESSREEWDCDCMNTA